MGKYDFDEIIDRRHTNSENVDGWRSYIFHCGPEKKFKYQDDEFIRMWVADMEFAVAPEIREALIERVDQRIFGYSTVSDEGYYRAFESWCFERYNMTFDRDHLVFSPGVIPALYQLTEDLVQPGEKVMTLTPAYGYFKYAADYCGAEMVPAPMKVRGGNGSGDPGRYEVDLSAFARAASKRGMKMVYLCNPHNPTGRVWTKDELLWIAGVVESNDLWLISDEIHCDLTRKGIQHTPMANVMQNYDKLVTCMSASKAFNMAGMLHSNIIIRNDEERKRFRKRDKLTGAVNPLSVEAHKAAYLYGGEWLAELQEYLDGNLAYVRDFLAEHIPGARFIMPEATYFAWVDLSEVLPEEEDLPLFFANEAGVLLEGGDRMFVDNARGCVRLNLAMPRSLVETGMQRIAEAIDRAG